MLPHKASLTTQGARLIPIFLGSLAGEYPSYLPERGICLSHGCFPRIRTSGLTDAWRWFGLGVKSSGASTVPGKEARNIPTPFPQDPYKYRKKTQNPVLIKV